MPTVLVVNAGSTSLKLHLVADDDTSVALASLADAAGRRVDAVAHRVVHGGSRFREPVAIDHAVREQIAELESIAPLHNAPALAGLDAAQQVAPDVPHVAVFDTAFHATIPPAAGVYAVPRQWRDDWGIRRYGFHGLSVEWSVERAAALLARPAAELRLVVCHLGGGSSVTAVAGGRSVDTTMGFTPLEGVPMTTRSGSVDPGALLYLLREQRLTVEMLDRALNLDSGLAALAAAEGGMVELEQAEAAGDPAAALALAVYVHRLAAAAAAMAASAGGVDALVFTAGIGEGSALVRERVCERLRFLGLELDRARNRSASPDCDVAAEGSGVRALVVRAREEVVAARAARALLVGRRVDATPAHGSRQ